MLAKVQLLPLIFQKIAILAPKKKNDKSDPYVQGNMLF